MIIFDFWNIDEHEHNHSWVSGMMYVHPEDLETVAGRREVICERCDAVYQADVPRDQGEQA